MRILYAVGSWGLGHAARSLPVLEALHRDGHELTVISHGRALLMLRRELGHRCEFLEWPHFPHTVGRSALGLYLRTALAIPAMLRVMVWERRATGELLRRRRFDRIVSDNRYGVQDRRVPSFHITNNVRFLAPGRLRPLEWVLEAFNYAWFRGLRRVIVPDTPEDALAGDLAHRLRIFPPELLAYVGLLSPVRARPMPRDVDVFITISGPEPQRSILERLVRAQLAGLPGRVVVTLGRPEGSGVERLGAAEVYDFLDRRPQEEMMNRARVVVARPGFSTLSAVAEVERQAVFIPTPGQTEQMYLATYHHARGTIYAASQTRLRLPEAVAEAARRSGLRARVKTAEGVRRVVELVSAG
ncbi:MAG: glycosyltransferase family protein [Armatimonadota bacterium]|nr:glycosyltransferase family protein [Armatimonadota bacterium]MDR7450928.1 glycosyltransferase family protein [Armatimonadota bacterium]MDR7465850.1 glycosyltransferase family protein [Armatimonadota bacterium]MDR7493758.1 glycosyltransferase family protein [Armatimonadota bacterium]MDR7498364.1 glycosyltransferase family protein [Armatimonadota bacterium]